MCTHRSASFFNHMKSALQWKKERKDVLFYKKKVHMSEKHTKLKVLTKIIIYPESLNALVSICPFNIPIGGVFSTKKNFNAEQSFSTTFFHVQNCLKIVLCHDLCTNILWRSFAWWLGVHKWCFSEPKLCANRDVLIRSLFSHAWLGSLYNTYRCLIAHLCGLLVMHGGNSFNIMTFVLTSLPLMLKELPPWITSSPQRCAIRHL